MANGTLTNNTGTITAAKQNNTIKLKTAGTYVTTDIELNVKVTKAILTTAADSNTFEIEVPNGAEGTITFYFSVDSNGNTTVTDAPSS